MLVSLLLVIGLYFPTSINSNSSSLLTVILSVILFLLFILLLLGKVKIRKIFLYFALGINSLLWFSTLISPFIESRYGTAFYYLNLSLLFCLDLREIKIGKLTNKIFFFINIINIFLGFAIIFQNISIVNFIVQSYSAFYPELVPNMVMQQKPVLTFATHSIAGFFFYLLFYLCVNTYKSSSNIIYLLFAISYMIFMFYLKSNTANIFLLIAFVQFLWFFLQNKPKLFYCITLGFGISYFFFVEKISNFLFLYQFQLSNSLSSSNNGLLARYSSSGNLQGNFDYLTQNYFRPVGFGYSKSIMYVDSGFLEYLTRGSLLLVLLIYIGFFLFLKKNLKSKTAAYTLFFMFLLFELGFSGLTYYRTLYFLPFIVVYLNSITAIKAVKEKSRRKIKISLSTRYPKVPFYK